MFFKLAYENAKDHSIFINPYVCQLFGETNENKIILNSIYYSNFDVTNHSTMHRIRCSASNPIKILIELWFHYDISTAKYRGMPMCRKCKNQIFWMLYRLESAFYSFPKKQVCNVDIFFHFLLGFNAKDYGSEPWHDVTNINKNSKRK